MSNKLKQITTKAKQLYKTGKFAKWTDAIKAASGKVVKRSKIGAAGDYAKFEIATIKSLAKVLKKSLNFTQQLVNNDQNLLNIISDSFDKKLTPLQTAKVIKKELTPEPKTDKLKAFVDILNKGAKGKTTGSKNFPMKLPATVTIGKVKKKTPAKSYHKDTKSHNVKIHVVSGISKNKKYNLYAQIQKMNGLSERLHFFYFAKLDDAKKAYSKILNELKEKKERGVYTIEIVNVVTLKPVKQITWFKI